MIYIDTETTGLDPEAEMLQFTAVSESGEVLFNKYFRPERHTEWADAERVNHLSPEFMKDKDYLTDEDRRAIEDILDQKCIAGFNVPFDARIMRLNGIFITGAEQWFDLRQVFKEYGTLKGFVNPLNPDKMFSYSLNSLREFCQCPSHGEIHNGLADSLDTLYCGNKLRQIINDEIKAGKVQFAGVWDQGFISPFDLDCEIDKFMLNHMARSGMLDGFAEVCDPATLDPQNTMVVKPQFERL